jgi:hypothetical protein
MMDGAALTAFVLAAVTAIAASLNSAPPVVVWSISLAMVGIGVLSSARR